MKWLVIRLDQIRIEGWHVIELATDDVDKADKAADAWEDENFSTLGRTQVFSIDEVKDLAKICNEVLASFAE